jgi:hypothetical protein
MNGPATQGPFPADALDANREGRLTDAQRKSWGASDRNSHGTVSLMALVVGVAGAFLVMGVGHGPLLDLLRLPAGVLCLGLAAVLFYKSVLGGGALTRDLQDGRVEMVEGAINRERGMALYAGPNPERCYLNVAGKRMACSRTAYEAAPMAGMVRVYYLPRSLRVVNLERMPDKPLPAGALDRPLEAAGQILKEFVTGDRTARAEAMANFSAMENAIRAEVTAKPAGEPDPRPLEHAIVGHWHSPIMDVTFTAGGSASARMLTGATISGRWSVGPDGKVRLQGMGGESEAAASVVGDALTIVMGGDSMTFRRAGRS